jgi:hypothetical protein
MSITVLTDASVTVSGVDLSDHVRRVTVTMSSDDVDITAMGQTAHNHAPGLRDDRVTVEFFQDFASSKVDATLNVLQGVQAGGTVVVKPTSGTVSATNPTYTLVGVLMGYVPLDGEVGAASMTTVEFLPAAGSKITRATT